MVLNEKFPNHRRGLWWSDQSSVPIEHTSLSQLMMAAHKSNEYVDESGSESEAEFEAPKHFHRAKPSTKVSLPDDKEVWLIKAPKGFPLGELKTLPVSFTATSVGNGPSTFRLNKQSFQVNEEMLTADTDSNKYAVLTHENKKSFKISDKSFSRFYNIREAVNVAPIDLDEVVKPRKDVKKIKNLRMRHFPTGYGASDFEESNPVVRNKEDDASDEESVTKDEDGKVVKKAKTEDGSKKEKKDKKEKKEKKEKKDKKSKKDKKDKKH